MPSRCGDIAETQPQQLGESEIVQLIVGETCIGTIVPRTCIIVNQAVVGPERVLLGVNRTDKGIYVGHGDVMELMAEIAVHSADGLPRVHERPQAILAITVVYSIL